MDQPTEIPASEVRGQISEVISRVAYGGERVVISRNGKAQVAVIPMADLDRLKKLDEQADQVGRRALAAIKAMQEQAVKEGLDKMTDEDIEAEIAATRRERRQRRKGK